MLTKVFDAGIYMTMKKEFYEKCADILDTAHVWREPVKKRTRWNTRLDGNGRYPGYGVIRWFHPNAIHVAFHHPKPGVSRMFTNEDDVYSFLTDIKN